MANLSPEEYEQLLADAKLGRLVRKLATTEYLLQPVQVYREISGKLEFEVTRWVVVQWDNGELVDVGEVCDNPIAALLAAGVSDE